MAKKPFSTKAFKDLEKEWKQKLKDSGFDDIEDKAGRLKQYDRRTLGFDCRDEMSDFFSRFNHYIQHNFIPLRDKNILELYCEGIRITGTNGIVERLGWSKSTVEKTVKKYKTLFSKKN